MSNQKTIWGKFLQPVFRLLIDEEKISQLYKSIDWEKESDRIRQPNLIYPDYYTSQNFHGVRGGYLNAYAAVTYDPVTQYALPPNESWVRQNAIEAIKGQPRRILDLGCGTGSTTIMLKQAFPLAEVTGVDLSPYMLVVAEHKAQQAGLEIQWRHDNAEKTRFLNASFDVVTASLLFHETPPNRSYKKRFASSSQEDKLLSSTAIKKPYCVQIGWLIFLKNLISKTMPREALMLGWVRQGLN
jgi:SAM-dependent methyltransferase